MEVQNRNIREIKGKTRNSLEEETDTKNDLNEAGGKHSIVDPEVI